MIGAALDNDHAVSAEEARKWLNALTAATLEALYNLDDMKQLLEAVTAPPEAEE